MVSHHHSLISSSLVLLTLIDRAPSAQWDQKERFVKPDAFFLSLGCIIAALIDTDFVFLPERDSRRPRPERSRWPKGQPWTARSFRPTWPEGTTGGHRSTGATWSTRNGKQICMCDTTCVSNTQLETWLACGV